MKELSDDHFKRSNEALKSSEALIDISPDNSASRAYYAAFHAISAFFALKGKTFKKHSAVRSALHKDLIKSGEWNSSLGEDYSFLLSLREVGDYGGNEHVEKQDALEAIEAAKRIISAVRID
ncbi:MAG: HEPN domain-containing protein [Planctomycetota bacterium]|jgi:uncharacterized protein (UPF0332 family)